MKMGSLDYRGHCELFKPIPPPKNTSAKSAAQEAMNVNMFFSRDFPASIWDRSRTDSFSLPKSLRNPCFSVVFMPLLFN